jgi:hypothetical protein
MSRETDLRVYTRGRDAFRNGVLCLGLTLGGVVAAGLVRVPPMLCSPRVLCIRMQKVGANGCPFSAAFVDTVDWSRLHRRVGYFGAYGRLT